MLRKINDKNEYMWYNKLMEKLFLNSNLHNVIRCDKANKMLNHAYLLLSADRVLSKKFASYVACEILCANDEVCLNCNTCRRVLNGTFSDVETYPQNDKPILTEDVNRIVSESYVLPLEAEKKIYILNDFDLATVQAQNKLLKTLEEPPESVIFVLTSSNENNVLPTIKSRCKKITLPQLEQDELKQYLVRNCGKSDAEASEIALVSPTLTLALKYVNSPNFMMQRKFAEDIIFRLSSSENVLRYGYEISNNVDDMEGFLNIFLEYICEISEKVAGGEKSGISMLELRLIADKVKDGIKKIKSNCNPNSVVDGLLMGILEVKYQCRK